MLSLRVINKAARLAVLLLALCAVFVASSACAADTLSLWNGEVKKGDILVRKNGAVQQTAFDQVASALGLLSKEAPGTFAITLDGKKIEIWNASNVVRASGTIISSPVPISAADGHWWVESAAVTQALNLFFASLGRPAAFEWKASSSDGAAAQQQAAQETQTPPRPTVQLPPQQPAPVVQPAQPPAPVIAQQTPKSNDAVKVAPPAEEKEISMPQQPIMAAFTGKERPVVVVDAGHGGHDPGAGANNLREKDINLKAALQLGEILRQYGIDVRLSRKTDVYLKLAERTAFANQNDADVFLSLHCNAMGKGGSSISGLEYYIMASPSDRDALNLAIAENKEISVGMDTAKDAQRADKKTQLLLKILGDMQQNDKINESTALTEVLHKAGKAAGLPIRKVKQAPFFVLRGAAMPAVLVEMGYITNAAEARKLNSAAYREVMLRSVAQGVVQYIKEHRVNK